MLINRQLTSLRWPPSIPEARRPDFSALAFIHEDDLFVFRARSGRLARVTATPAAARIRIRERRIAPCRTYTIAVSFFIRILYPYRQNRLKIFSQ